jgi:Repeat of unknown function (DUF346)
MPGTNWSRWASLGRPGGGAVADSVFVAQGPPGQLLLAATGTGRSLHVRHWARHQSDRTAGTWTDTGLPVGTAATGAFVHGERFLLALVDTEGNLGYLTLPAARDRASETYRWIPIGGPGLRSPAAVAWDADTLDVFTYDADGVLYQCTLEDDHFAGLTAIGRGITESPTPASWGSRRLDLFTRSPEGLLWHKWWDDAPDRFDVFELDSVRDARHKWWPPGHGWLPSPHTEWEPLGGFLSAMPAVVSWAPFHLDVFARGIDGHVQHRWWGPETGWMPNYGDGWEDLGGVLATRPVAVSWAIDRLAVFARSVDGTINYKYRDPGINWRPSLAAWYGLPPGGEEFVGTPIAVVLPDAVIGLLVTGQSGTVYWSESR